MLALTVVSRWATRLGKARALEIGWNRRDQRSAESPVGTRWFSTRATNTLGNARWRRFPAATDRAVDFGVPALLTELRAFAFVLVLDAEAYRAAAKERRSRGRGGERWDRP